MIKIAMAWMPKRRIEIQSLLLVSITWLLLATSILSQTNPALPSSDGSDNRSSETDTEEKDSTGDDFDKLLNLAEKDVSQLANVKVSTSVPSMNTEVSTVSRTTTTIGKTPAAVFVITNDMIRRSGATSVPEVLRMAPGVEVARIDSNKWSVSIRGFNDRFANKLLVQVDGRTVYSPLFAGVFWDVQDLFLEDVDRIEIIRGPGASVWGANAVNGVINVITKSAAETHGAFGQVGTGTYERGFANLRYGGQLGSSGIQYRVYGKWFDRGQGTSVDGIPPNDDWNLGSGGFRADWDLDGSGTDKLMFTGDSFSSRSGGVNTFGTLAPPYIQTSPNQHYQNGSHIVGRWTHKVDDEREWQVQSYFDTTSRHTIVDGFSESRDTFDLDTQYRFPMGDFQKVVIGAAFRTSTDQLPSGTFPYGHTVASQRINMASAFIQDAINLVEDRWELTLGCKFFEQTYVGFDYQPTARLLFTPDERHSYWGSVSRAIRVPCRGEETNYLYGIPIETTPVPVYVSFQGNPNVKSEELLAWELGYRTQATEAFSYDATAFYNNYDDLIFFRPTGIGPSPYGMTLNYVADNTARAQAYGFEIASNYEITKSWRLRSAYSHLQIFMDDITGTREEEGQTPQNQLYLQSSREFGKNVELDVIGRYVGALSDFSIPDYFVSDIRLGWKPRKSVECFVVGRGLFDDGHQEFRRDIAVGGAATGVRSEIYTGISIRR